MAKKQNPTNDTALANAALVDVVATIDAGTKAPADLIVGLQIDSKRLTMVGLKGKARISTGVHTTSWGVVSPTVRPLPFAVTIVASDGRTLVNRPHETTGADGMGVGADMFSA